MVFSNGEAISEMSAKPDSSMAKINTLFADGPGSSTAESGDNGRRNSNSSSAMRLLKSVTSEITSEIREMREGPKPTVRPRPSEPSEPPAMMFVDADAMKEKVREALTKPQYCVFDFYHTEGLWQLIARHPIFENVTLAVIALNAIWIAVDTDINTEEVLFNAHPVFQIMEQFFCLYFTMEWFIRFKAFKRKRNGLRDGWFTFDSILVFMMVMETWVMNAILTLSGGSGGGGLGGNASILRLFRLLRLSRMARMLRSMPELMILIKGMVSAMRSVFFVMCLLIIIMYVFAIAFTQLSAETIMGAKYFDSVGMSMYSLLVYGTLLDNLAAVCNEIGRESGVCLLLFGFFVLLAALTVMNMLIGVLCEVVSAVASTEKEEMVVTFVTGKLQQILEQLDANCDMQISRDEFMQILANPEAARALEEVGVDPVGVVDFVDFIFDDQDDEEAVSLTFGDFMQVVLKLRGSNTATVRDIVDLRKFVYSAVENLTQRLMAQKAGGLADSVGKRPPLRKPTPTRPAQKAAPQKSASCASMATPQKSATCGALDAVKDDTNRSGGWSPVNLSPRNANAQGNPPPDAESRQEMKKLEGRLVRAEHLMTTVLSEVRKLGAQLPPPPVSTGTGDAYLNSLSEDLAEERRRMNR
mmetsp:Transcript_28798/g.61193  ORF Transcript_28798/g.61193 Transcript_28798/m.61193 type:complete len:641 (+) Transcript_28798:83-2005(+)